ncbi:MAG: STAS domain-containing protein [Proteiniphilum sp.]|jgi:anti-anti-sigma factor|nr:STAS domain-containing protein [Proteiniphilum sp.]
MGFTVKKEIFEKYIAFTLCGSLDSSTAPQFNEEVRQVILQNPQTLVLYVDELNFMSSAGLRVLIFAKQKLGTAASLILVRPQEQLLETLRMTGLIFSVSIVDQYPE